MDGTSWGNASTRHARGRSGTAGFRPAIRLDSGTGTVSPKEDSVAFVHQAKTNAPDAQRQYLPPAFPFSEEQMYGLRMVQTQIQSVNSATERPHKRILVQGEAGTGKSTVIQAVTTEIARTLGDQAFLLVAPTGAAAVNIGGETIHSALKLPTQASKSKDLGPELERELQEVFANTHFLICDEYSMVGMKMLDQIDKKCRQIKASDEFFGGMLVYFLGDVRQLPPVMDVPAYGENFSSEAAANGKTVFSNFQKCFFCETSQRQAGINPDQISFRTALKSLSDGKSTEEGYELFLARRIHLGQHSTLFRSSRYVFSVRDKDDEHNENTLRSNMEPVTRINVKHNNKTAESASEEEAQGLEPIVLLSRGARVMLIVNLWTRAGLVNGTAGEVVDILYGARTNPPTDMPFAVMVKFDCWASIGLYQPLCQCSGQI